MIATAKIILFHIIKEVLNQLSKEILAGKINTDSIILLDSFNGELVFRNQGDLVEDEF